MFRRLLKEYFRKNLPEEEAVRIAIRALSNAAEEDVGTGGPDLLRRIFPTVKLVDQQGVRDVEEAQLEIVCQELLTKEEEA